MSTLAVEDPVKAYQEHESWLRTALQARLNSSDEVEEVLQEVAVAAANQSVKEVPVDRTGPWLYRVALRQVMLFRRKAGRRKKLVKNFAAGRRPVESDSGREDPLRFLLLQERRQAVREAMGHLCERDRQLLLLKYVEGYSYGQIAERVGVTPSAVQSRLHRARAALRKHLAD